MEAVKQVKTEEPSVPIVSFPGLPLWEEESGNETTVFDVVEHIVEMDNQQWL